MRIVVDFQGRQDNNRMNLVGEVEIPVLRWLVFNRERLQRIETKKLSRKIKPPPKAEKCKNKMSAVTSRTKDNGWVASTASESSETI